MCVPTWTPTCRPWSSRPATGLPGQPRHQAACKPAQQRHSDRGTHANRCLLTPRNLAAKGLVSRVASMRAAWEQSRFAIQPPLVRTRMSFGGPSSRPGALLGQLQALNAKTSARGTF